MTTDRANNNLSAAEVGNITFVECEDGTPPVEGIVLFELTVVAGTVRVEDIPPKRLSTKG